ncbi:hypothetical protein EN812_05935 [Mesorhizobium sp. M4B.F.Ca.ET.169.01.1.1]|uniref:DUF6894 family protein n=1 Tax=Mesorhizobium sp. M4B.F.Ca.ET.169.01.1.1 TaxID=2563949 RepID=UPI0010936E54|nr:hypothetical protein [Mesorhizobium sp. M4B.F.Ca.ET.169.01.1.1]TGT46876.1 hypothetical protein EN812_05935 [Mesorhizobium sp. M4B.F.Ca.ET.169.01.1.1]
MALYFFDFYDDDVVQLDTEGTELSSFDAVKHQAVRALVDVIREVLPDGPHRELSFKVRDEAGRQLMQVVMTFHLQGA